MNRRHLPPVFFIAGIKKVVDFFCIAVIFAWFMLA
jgi:hypothetical protein